MLSTLREMAQSILTCVCGRLSKQRLMFAVDGQSVPVSLAPCNRTRTATHRTVRTWETFSLLPFLPTHCSCGGLLLHLMPLSDTPHLVRLLWMRDRPVAAVSACAKKNSTKHIATNTDSTINDGVYIL
jgi:hypothetical protein